MIALQAVVLSALVNLSRCLDLTFPPGFKFGAATAAYQIEGAWNISDKGESVWDRFTHNISENIAVRNQGDIACDSYHLWRQDVEIAVNLGLHFYRFSISWPRLLPTGFPNYVSEDGKRYYSDLIDGLLANGVEPVITIYHWDLPQRLQDLGGWTNPHITEWYTDYARVVFNLFADRVKIWLTVNEPIISCDLAYNTGFLAPGILDFEFANYLCGKHMLIAHAKAWRMYDKEYKPKHRGQVSLANQLFWFEPASQEYGELAELTTELMNGRYSHPVYSKEGGWPPTIEEIIADNSRTQGFIRSRLPKLTKEEIKLIKGTFDFYALNYYTSRRVRKLGPNDTIGTWLVSGEPELDVMLDVDPNWDNEGVNDLMPIYAKGLRKTLVWLKKNYGDIPYCIMENGYSTAETNLNDDKRVGYIRDHLEQVLLAIKEDGVNVTGYTVWSMLDNFEWMTGYNQKFGLYEVDFTSPHRTRIPRKSAEFYSKVIRLHSLDVSIQDLKTLSNDNNSRNNAIRNNPYDVLNILLIIFVNCIIFRSLVLKLIINKLLS